MHKFEKTCKRHFQAILGFKTGQKNGKQNLLLYQTLLSKSKGFF